MQSRSPLNPAVDENGLFRFGRSQEPFDPLNFEEADLSDLPSWWGRPQRGWLGRAFRRMRLKKWHYVGICHPRFYLCAAVVDLGYVGNTFCYLIDRESGEKYETERLLPFAVGLRVSPKARGRTRGGGLMLDFENGEWRVKLKVVLQGKPLKAEAFIPVTTPLCLLYPLHTNRAAHTHKEVAAPCRGTLEWRDQTIDLNQARAGIDYTHSYADRRTDWHWLFLTGTLLDGREFGLNLSELLYDDAENFVWLDGRLHHLGRAVILPSNKEPWRISGPRVDLQFEPLGERGQNVDLGLVRSVFRQPYGQAHGTFNLDGKSHEIASAFGVAEEHHAVW